MHAGRLAEHCYGFARVRVAPVVANGPTVLSADDRSDSFRAKVLAFS
ncbi:MAG: hypothetical protein ACRDZ6_10790 [Acidimicrobiales bacterium]